MKRTWTSIDWKETGAAQGWKCASCTTAIDATAELDHTVPLSNGGTNDASNAQLLCVTCHKNKSQREEKDRIARCRDKLEARTRRHLRPRQSDTLGKALENVLSDEGKFDFSLYVCPLSLIRHRCLLSSYAVGGAESEDPASPSSPAERLRFLDSDGLKSPATSSPRGIAHSASVASSCHSASGTAPL